MRIAFPTNSPGGLEAVLSEHFGDCDLFTIVDLDPTLPNMNATNIQLHENTDHINCGIPILRLQRAGVELIILHKIGPLPLEILQKENIPLLAGQGTVREVLQQFYENRLRPVTTANICAGKIQNPL